MSLQRRLTLLLLASLLALLLPLGLFTIFEARRAALQTLETSVLARLGFYRAVSADRLGDLSALAQEYGGYGFLQQGGELSFTDTGGHTLPPAVEEALAAGMGYTGLHGDTLMVSLPFDSGGGVGLALQVEAVAALTSRLLLAYVLAAAGLFVLVGFFGRWALRSALAPIVHLSKEISSRSPTNLAPFPEPNIAEVQPTVQRLNELIAELSSALSRSHVQEQAARRFAAQASHELRTPLTALRGYVEVLERRPDEPRARAGMRREMDRSQRLIDSLLTLARLEGRAQAETEVVDLPDFVCEFLPELRFEGRGRILAEPGLLELALKNLRTNAERYGTPPYRLWLEPADPKGWLVFEDRGPGFPEELLGHALEPFVHGDNQGTGLGLAIVRAVAEVHGGEVRLENLAGGGARVRMSFSLASA